jgi:hypothetical protein
MSKVILLPASLVDAKGDLLVGSADNTVIRKAVGTDGQILTADASVAGGVKWATPAAAASGTGRSFVTGLYSQPDVVGADNQTVVLGNGTLTALPFSVGRTTTFDRIGIEVTTLAAATNLRMGIYNDAGGPGSLLLDAGLTTADASTTGLKTATISQALPVGLYWVAVVAQGGTPTVRGIANNPNGWMPSAQGTGPGYPSYLTGTTTPAALPASFGTISVTQNVANPKIVMRAA